ncbi:MAG: Dyp-type peroxidase [Actinobacteria bacterium]|nr:Dyp-type peroxidase [Actinomycetota bacterium]
MSSQLTPQAGIFALGTTAHAYLEFDVLAGVEPAAVVSSVGAVARARVTGQGSSVVIGFRPSLWRRVVPSPAACPEATDFAEPIVGDDGFTMPATQHDVFVWIAAGRYDTVFDQTAGVADALAPVAVLAEETRGWIYQHDRDLTGFIDGTKNPPLVEATQVAIAASGQPGEGGSVLLLQRWRHDWAAWSELGVPGQQDAMGRTKPDSVELKPLPPTSHVARTDQDEVGQIFRRNTPYGTVSDHGTVFVGFCHSQQPLADMLHRMAGIGGEPRDELTRYTVALSGAYYVIPAHEHLPVAPDRRDGTDGKGASD